MRCVGGKGEKRVWGMVDGNEGNGHGRRRLQWSMLSGAKKWILHCILGPAAAARLPRFSWILSQQC